MQIDSEKHPDLNYLIVGGGPTGIELAGMLPHYIKDVAARHGAKKKKVNVWLIEGFIAYEFLLLFHLV
jgi:NADH dehydrogenase FAD-containing subunit